MSLRTFNSPPIVPVKWGAQNAIGWTLDRNAVAPILKQQAYTDTYPGFTAASKVKKSQIGGKRGRKKQQKKRVK